MFCSVSDDDGDELMHVWTTTTGYIEYYPNHDTIKYTPIHTYGRHYVALEIRDGEASVRDTVDLTHNLRGNEEDFIPIPAGLFYITTYEGHIAGYQTVEAFMDHDYEIMRYEVTNGQYVRFLNALLDENRVSVRDNAVFGVIQGDDELPDGEYLFYIDCRIDLYDDEHTLIVFTDGEFQIAPAYSKHPAAMVSWYGAHEYARHYNFRLPTEHEWIRAARGRDTRKFPWGNRFPDCSVSNTYYGCEYGTSEIGVKSERSPFGLCDMAGNVSEWMSDNGAEPPLYRNCGWNFYARNHPYSYLSDCCEGPATAILGASGFRCAR